MPPGTTYFPLASSRCVASSVSAPGADEQHHPAVPDPDVGAEPAGRPHHGSAGHREIEHPDS